MLNRLIAILLGMGLLLVVFGCDRSGPPAETPPSEKPEAVEETGPPPPTDMDRRKQDAMKLVKEFTERKPKKDTKKHGTNWKTRLGRSKFELKVTINKKDERIFPTKELIEFKIGKVHLGHRQVLRGFFLMELIDKMGVEKCAGMTVGAGTKSAKVLTCEEILQKPTKWMMVFTRLGTIKMYDAENATSVRQSHPRHVRWIDIQTAS